MISLETQRMKRERERERERKNGLCNCINVNFKKYRFLSNHQLNTLRGQLKECLNSYWKHKNLQHYYTDCLDFYIDNLT